MRLYGKTDIGRKRLSNQDMFHFGTMIDGTCYAVVCDGMGGENGGQIASAVASHTICEYLEQHYTPDMSDEQCRGLIIAAVSAGNLAVYEKALAEPEYHGMGTTCVLALIQGDKAHVGHVGDSRVYVLREGELVQVTTDHSIVQTMLDRGEITLEEAAIHPRKNMITRAVGVSNRVDIDYLEISNMPYTSLLLCSDGLTNCCTDEQMRDILLQTTSSAVCDALVDAANAAGGIDNITAIFVTNREDESHESV